MTTARRWMRLVALCAVAACSTDPADQVITGRVDPARGPLAIRAVADGEVVTAAAIRTDGSFTIVLPVGSHYRLEVLTRTGLKKLVKRADGSLRDIAFSVCDPGDPFDVGGVDNVDPNGMCTDPNDPSCKPPEPCMPQPDGTCCPAGDPSCQPPSPCTDPMDPNCQPPKPCDPADVDCKCFPDGTCCSAMDPSCVPPPGCNPMDPGCTCYPDGTCCGPNDPACNPPPCDDPMDPNCGGCNDPMDPMCCAAFGTCPPPDCQPGDPSCGGTCDPTTDPYCKCDANGNCYPCMDPTDPNCGGGGGGCGPNDPNCMGGCLPDGTCPPTDCSDPTAPGCMPPCEDPMDPTTCKDPCLEDPTVCGCMSNEPNCWPPPEPCCDDNGMCDAGEGMEPDNAPGDFGCQEMKP